MKTSILFFSAVLVSIITVPTFAQVDCPFPTAVEELDVNNVKARYSNNGSDWNNQSLGRSGYEIPKGDGTHSIFAGGMWITGKNSANELKVNIRMFRQSPFEWSICPGPMNNLSPGEFVSANTPFYDHIYKINKSEVVLHRLYFEMLAANDGVPPTESPFENGYDIPENILYWPTTAEVIPGQQQNLAPFFDNDCCGGNPGIYEPELGDYPAFRFPDNEDAFDCEAHLLGDQVLWWVVNDAYGEHEDYQPLGIEIHNMAYAYITNDHINNTTFLRRTIINRSGDFYTDTYLGQFIDVDLGGSQDDHVGADVERGMAYFYNGDNYDENNSGGVWLWRFASSDRI